MPHSPEPWIGEDVYCDNGKLIHCIQASNLDEVVGERFGTSEENRDRIVACVNAYRGIPTELLQHVARRNTL